MAFIISKSCIHLVSKDSCKNQYLMLVVLSQFKIHTTHQVTTIGYLHYFPVMQANIFTHAPNFHTLSLLHKASLFKVYDFTALVTHVMQSIQGPSHINFYHESSSSSTSFFIHQHPFLLLTLLPNICI